MAKRKRDIQLKFRVTPQEREMIETKMAQFGTTNMAAYLRKMAIDGYVVKLDLPELRELVSLLRYSSNNLNQLTRRAHETGRIYEADLEDIQQSQERIWTAAEKIVSSLAAPLFTQSKSPASLQSARCHGILILEKHNVFEKEAVKCLF